MKATFEKHFFLKKPYCLVLPSILPANFPAEYVFEDKEQFGHE